MSGTLKGFFRYNFIIFRYTMFIPSCLDRIQDLLGDQLYSFPLHDIQQFSFQMFHILLVSDSRPAALKPKVHESKSNPRSPGLWIVIAVDNQARCDWPHTIGQSPLGPQYSLVPIHLLYQCLLNPTPVVVHYLVVCHPQIIN